MLNSSVPKTRPQSSRRNKKAWRKNVNLENLEQNLMAARDSIIHSGGTQLSNLAAEDIYQTDVNGSQCVEAKLRKARSRTKAEDILAQRSAVTAIDTRKTPLQNNSPHKTMNRTKRRRYTSAMTEDQRMQQSTGPPHLEGRYDLVIEDPGSIEDMWPLEDAHTQIKVCSNSVGGAEDQKLLTGHQMSSLPAITQKVANVDVPGGGRSYNPLYADWSKDLAEASNREVEAERRRRRQSEYLKSFDSLRQSRSNHCDTTVVPDDLESEHESEWEGIQSDSEHSQITPRRPARLTPSQRNSVRRRKIAESIAKHEQRMQQRTSRPNHVIPIERQQGGVSLEGFNRPRESAKKPRIQESKVAKSKMPTAPLELVLSDELKDSLRLLRPEGNLLQDRFRNAILQGKIEPRQMVGQSKKAKVKATEKWSYKDWRLPRKQ